MNDKWEFRISNLRKWRWRRISPSGDVVGSSPTDYSIRADCEDNAQLNGWITENAADKDMTDGEKLYVENHESNRGPDLENAGSAVESLTDRKTEKLYRVTRDSRQRRMMILIAIILGLILLTALFILFEPEEQVEMTNIHRLTTGRGHDLPIMTCVSRDTASLNVMSGVLPRLI